MAAMADGIFHVYDYVLYASDGICKKYPLEAAHGNATKTPDNFLVTVD
jgi:hypothetical protein